MAFSKLLLAFCAFQALLAASSVASATNTALYVTYLGAMWEGVTFDDIPYEADVEVHVLLSFALDFTLDSASTPTNGKFNVNWDTENLTPDAVKSIKSKYPNVKVGVSLGGASLNSGDPLYFQTSDANAWVNNAVSSLTSIIQQYNLDGIDIDYEQSYADQNTFSDCIGKLITQLKNNKVISFASIAPYDDGSSRLSYYQTLVKSYGNVIDYVNFQFYAYDSTITIDQFLQNYDTQAANFNGIPLLISFSDDWPNDGAGLNPANDFFTAAQRLKDENKLNGIFDWCVDDAKSQGFKYTKQAQQLVAN